MTWRILWPLILAAFLALFSVNFLMGLPGALFMDVVLRQEVAPHATSSVQALAIMISSIAPFGVAPALWAMMAWRPSGAWWQWSGAAFAGYLAAGAAATLNVA